MLEPTTMLIVPNSFNGSLFKLHSIDNDESREYNINNVTIDGGIIEEAESPERKAQGKWIAILLLNSVKYHVGGIYHNRISNMTIRNAEVGIKLLIDGKNGYISYNSFEFLNMIYNKTFIDFDLKDVQYLGKEEQPAIDRNYFEGLVCYLGPDSKFVARNIQHKGNIFVNVNVYGQSTVTTSIHQNASDTIILDGTLTHYPLIDQGVNTRIISAGSEFSKLLKTGLIYGTNVNLIGEGLLAGLEKTGNENVQSHQDNLFGQFLVFSTSDKEESTAGIRTNLPITQRAWSPRIKVRLRPDKLYSDQQVYVGWTSSIEPIRFKREEGGILLIPESGVLVVGGLSEKYQIIHSGENDATYYIKNTNVLFDNTLRTIEITATPEKFLIRLDDNNLQEISDNIPALNTGLTFHLQTFTETKSQRSIHLFNAELTQTI
jgi:hypothetical protein